MKVVHETTAILTALGTLTCVRLEIVLILADIEVVRGSGENLPHVSNRVLVRS
jgi:hypothetical protein